MSFDDWDVYYLYEYVLALSRHGDGAMKLILFTEGDIRLCYVVMERDIATDPRFADLIEPGTFYDWETPYGYGGPLSDSVVPENIQRLFLEEISSYCSSNHIVSQFVRFHPLLDNYKVLPQVIETRYMRDTIYMDTSVDAAGIFANMDSKNRNMVRKAMNSGVQIVHHKAEYLPEFLLMYEETMHKNEADLYYLFDRAYYDTLLDREENVDIFYAVREGEILSGAIIMYTDTMAHYHLAGSHTEARIYSPNNLLLYEVACWAHEKGIRQFHLGGGMAPEDSLFGFKKQFNKNGRAAFYVGRTIFDEEAYKRLLQLRKKADADFDTGNGFMIQYRR